MQTFSPRVSNKALLGLSNSKVPFVVYLGLELPVFYFRKDFAGLDFCSRAIHEKNIVLEIT
jgi:hypothetical protein